MIFFFPLNNTSQFPHSVVFCSLQTSWIICWNLVEGDIYWVELAVRQLMRGVVMKTKEKQSWIVRNRVSELSGQPSRFFLNLSLGHLRASLVTLMVKHLPAMQETRVQSLGWEDLLEKEMATHSSTLAWRIPRTEEPDGPQSMRSQKVGHDWATSLSLSLGHLQMVQWKQHWPPDKFSWFECHWWQHQIFWWTSWEAHTTEGIKIAYMWSVETAFFWRLHQSSSCSSEFQEKGDFNSQWLQVRKDKNWKW